MLYIITKNIDHNLVTIFCNGETIIKFKDIKGKNDLSFQRELDGNSSKYQFLNGQLVLKQLTKKTKFMAPVKTDKFLINKFLTLDIETYKNIKNKLIPYCISYYTGKYAESFYLTDFKNPNEMMEACISTLLHSRFNGYNVYVHNLSLFDGIFLMGVLSSMKNCTIKPQLRKGKIINIKVSFNKGKHFINFRDSLLILPVSLAKLAKSFNLENKGIFPYAFPNEDNLNYRGFVPSKSFFNDMSDKLFNVYLISYANKSWSLPQETIKYCELDCKLLYDIIFKFNELIFNKFEINIHSCPSLPSLAFTIYRAKYLKDFKIPLITGELFDNIRKAYTGGAVDVYKSSGTDLYTYDINSLYPFQMQTQLVPVGTIKYVEGNILDIYPLEELFGFFEVEITAPLNLQHPIIQTKMKIDDAGMRTVAPLGTWTDWLFSEEIKNSIEKGYTFKFIKGYLFDKENIFKEYIDELYELKVNSSKDDPMYLIAKLLMNSLYGRFGMADDSESHIIVDDVQVSELHEKYEITDSFSFDNGKSLVTFQNKVEDDILDIDSKFNISIGIAAAITAYARIHMSQFKNNSNYNLYYSDTDSIIIDKPLDIGLVGKEIGKMKLENTLTEGTFIAPKVYGGILPDGTEFAKVKGFKDNISYNNLKNLLDNNNKCIKLNQDKWFRSFEEGSITISNQLYTLRATENKRKLVYVDNKLIKTVPFTINNNKEIV